MRVASVVVSKRLLMIFLVVCMIMATGCIARPSANSLIIQRTAHYRLDASARDKIRDECDLEHEVPKYIKKYADGDYDSIFFSDTLSEDTPAKVLVLKIVNAHGIGGGWHTGPKSLTVEGTLTQNGKVLGTFVAHRATMRGGHGTCGLLVYRCAKKIGTDVEPWIKKPTMNALLGTAKASSLPEAATDADDKDD